MTLKIGLNKSIYKKILLKLCGRQKMSNDVFNDTPVEYTFIMSVVVKKLNQ